MSSAGPSGDPSAPADAAPAPTSLPALVSLRGRPLLEGLERHVPGSIEHANATAAYSLAAAAELGFARHRAELVREVAKLHEIGKVYLPAELLAKPISELTSAERAGLDRHHIAGAQLAAGAGIPAEACEWIRTCGERFDGHGPLRLAGDAIPAEARVIHAACVCEGTADRARRPRLAGGERRPSRSGRRRAYARSPGPTWTRRSRRPSPSRSLRLLEGDHLQRHVLRSALVMGPDVWRAWRRRLCATRFCAQPLFVGRTRSEIVFSPCPRRRTVFASVGCVPLNPSM